MDQLTLDDRDDSYSDQSSINSINSISNSPSNKRRNIYQKRQKEQNKDANKDTSGATLNEQKTSFMKRNKSTSSTDSASSDIPRGKEILTNKRLTRRGRISDMNIVMEDGTMITGYAMTNPKRNRAFHNYFNEIPHNEHLINAYSCALQKEILIQGKIFVSLKNICFHANIFGWVTNAVIPFSDITAIEKKVTAFVIPTAILIVTGNSKYLFTSFLSRDIVYDLFMKLWKHSNSCDSSSGYEETDLSSDNNQKSLKTRNESDSNINSSQDSDSCEKNEKAIENNKSQDPDSSTINLHKKDETICDCLKNKRHFDNEVLDTKFKGSVEKIYNLVYTSGFIVDFLKHHEKNDCINMGEWIIDEDGKLVRHSNYKKRLNKTSGPTDTKCYLKDEVLHQDFDDYTTMITSIETPDIPSNDSIVKTRTCIMRAGSKETRIIVTCTVEFPKLTLFKATIEKASLEGQVAYYKALETAVRKYISQNISEFDDENTSRYHSLKQNPTTIKKSHLNEERKTISRKLSNQLRIPNFRNIILVAFILALTVQIYIWVSLRNITKSIEQYSGPKSAYSEFHSSCTLNEWLYELKKSQLLSILYEYEN